MLTALLCALSLQSATLDEPPMIMAALTQETVEIRSDFAGAELVLFGATRGLTLRDEIIVVLRGPEENLRVMQKARSFGVWLNRDPIAFEDVPGFYAIAATRPLNEFADPAELIENELGIAPVLAARQSEPLEGGAVDAALASAALAPYREAIARAMSRDGLFSANERGVEVLDGGIFRARLMLPPLTPVGDYTADVYLFRDGHRVASRSVSLRVEKAGIERVLYGFAHGAPLIYGLFCVALAMLAGYVASAIFNRD